MSGEGLDSAALAGAPLRVLIVDDEPPARGRLRELLHDCRAEMPLLVIGEAGNGLEALNMVGADRPDVVMVDIDMPAMSGIEFARHLQVLEQPPAVIFVTAYDRYAIEAFEVNAVDYLLKPVRAARLATALRKAASGVRAGRETLERVDARPRRFFSVAERGRVHLVPVAEVIFLKAELKYVAVRTSEREYAVEESLTRLEAEFPGIFIRIHRSCLVARRLIRGVERIPGDDGSESEGWAVVLEGLAERLPVSRRQWSQVKALLTG